MEPHSFSIYGLVLSADPVVKAVLLILVLASVTCWAIMLEKLLRFAKLNGELALFEGVAKNRSMAEGATGLAHVLSQAARNEAQDGGAPGEERSEVRARLERAMRSALRSELQGAETGLPFLATTGSAAPFIGLFGTVWGIMNAFAAIAQKQDTSLATVAPGIAEALFATALGLAAAIPAVMAYNHFAVKLGRAASRGSASIAEIAKHMSHPTAAGTLYKPAVETLRTGGLT